MKHAFAFIPVLALAATAAIAADATSEVSLPALPDAPVLPPAKPASPPNKAAPAKPDQPKAKAPAPRPQPKSTEIDLSSSKVLSAETEDGKPVYVVFQNNNTESILFADNEGGGWIGNTYVKVGGGVLSRVGSKKAKPHGASGSYMDVDISLELNSWLSFRIAGMTLLDSEVDGGYEGEHAYISVDGSEFNYSAAHPMLLFSANQNGVLNPFAGVGFIIQRAQVRDCKWISYGSWSRGIYQPTKTEDYDSDGSFFAPTVGLEINVHRVHFSGECIFSIGADSNQTNPFDVSGNDHGDFVYGGRVSLGFSATDNLSVFGTATMTQAFQIFGGGVGWRF